ncbi:MAG: transcriptional regulator FeaR [Marinomonas foliarum]
MLNLERWEQTVKQVCGDFHTKPHSYIPFFGEIELQSYDGLEVAHIETNAQKIDRVLNPQKENKHYFVILQQKGVMGFSNTQNEQILLHPGEIALIDSSASYSMHPQGLIQQMSVHIPKCVLDNFGDNHKAIFTKITQHQTSSKVLLTILRQLAYAPSSQYDGEGQAIQQAISALIQPSINSENTKITSSLKEIAQQHILRLLPETDLCPERLAKEMQMSKRSLYRLFSEENTSIARLILKLRIEQCCKELIESDMLQQPLSLTEVAFRWGFSDTSQFSRAFKRIKGVSPSVWRESKLEAHNELRQH